MIKLTRMNIQAKNKPEKSTPKLTWLPDKTFELEFVLPWSQVKLTYDEVLKTTAKNITIKGFRPGKAPLNLVEKNLDKQKLFQQVLTKILPDTYLQAVKKHNLRPIISPKVSLISGKEGQDWQFKAKACEAPEFKLHDYQKIAKESLAKTKIWVPGQPKTGDKKEKDSYDKKLQEVSQALLAHVSFSLPQILVEDEVNRELGNLIDQLGKVGMTIDSYCSSKGITPAILRTNYEKKVTEMLRLEFILQAIIADRKIKIEANEIDELINKNSDPKIKESLNQPHERAYLASILAKRKVLDYLTSL